MQNINTVCVYCSARYNAGSEIYLNAAEEMGRLIAKQGWNLVCGAGNHGLMGNLINGAANAGGHVTGIMPRHILEQELKHPLLSDLILVDTLHERKKMMSDRADAFVILPGGYGTLEEAIEILTWRQVGLHKKPIIFLNINDFWEPIKQQKLRFFQEGFVTENDMTLFRVVDKPSDVLVSLAEEGYAVAPN